MNLNLRATVALALLAIALGGLGACVGTSAPAQFYVLEPSTTGAASPPANIRSLTIGAVRLPRMLDRPQIVTALDGGQVGLSEQHRWAEDLDANVTRVLGQNLAVRLSGVDIATPGVPTGDLRLGLVFDEFGGRLGDRVRLSGVWRLRDQRGDCDFIGARVPTTPQRFAIDVATAGPGYREFAAALSAGVGRLSDQIAAHIAKLPAAAPDCRR